MKRHEMRLLVCGGRDFHNRAFVFSSLDKIREKGWRPQVIIHGAARGADSLAGMWAEERGIDVLAFPAGWEAHGKAAGHIRNKQMLDEGKPTHVVAFPGGRGTANMVNQAKAAGLYVWEPIYSESAQIPLSSE
jgi:hypothetical protein